MFLIFNWSGIVIIILSLILYFLGISITGLTNSNYLFYLVNGILLIVFDLITRFAISKKYKKIKGGTFFFVPIYIIGILCLILGIYFFFI